MKKDEAITLEGCQLIVDKAKRKLGKSFEIVSNLVSEAIKDRDSYWDTDRSGKRPVYICVDCGNKSSAPTKYCPRCGTKKIADDGKIKRR